MSIYFTSRLKPKQIVKLSIVFDVWAKTRTTCDAEELSKVLHKSCIDLCKAYVEEPKSCINLDPWHRCNKLYCNCNEFPKYVLHKVCFDCCHPFQIIKHLHSCISDDRVQIKTLAASRESVIASRNSSSFGYNIITSSILDVFPDVCVTPGLL